MALSTENLRRYAQNLDILADKHPSLADYVEELHAITQHVGDLVDNFNALLAKLDADTGVEDDDYEATLEVGGEE